MDRVGTNRVKRANDCFSEDPESLVTDASLIHEARRKRIRVGTQPSGLFKAWENAARINSEQAPPTLDTVNYSNQIQTALGFFFHEIFNAVNKVQNVLFKISTDTGRTIKTAKRVYIIDTQDVEMQED